MNVYDFDKTIFYPDSSYTFVGFCLKRHPGRIIRHVPEITKAWLKRACGRASTKELKEAVFSFLRETDDLESQLNEFWKKYEGNLRPWYLRQKRDDDLVISASPEFLIGPCCEKLGIRYMGTRMDPKTGKIAGQNCHDSEKVVRFRESYAGCTVEEFYSDSYSDSPMAELAEKAVLVKKDELLPW